MSRIPGEAPAAILPRASLLLACLETGLLDKVPCVGARTPSFKGRKAKGGLELSLQQCYCTNT